MRVFLGLEPTPEQKLAIAAWRDRVLPWLDNPVPMTNFHLTLAFLGELEPPQLDRLETTITEALKEQTFQADRLVLDQLGYWEMNQLLWIGPTTWPASLNRLSKRLQQIGNQLGVRSDKKPFQPHVTLSRKASAPVTGWEAPNVTIEYEELVLFESIRGREGSRYHAITSWPLEIPLQRVRPSTRRWK